MKHPYQALAAFLMLSLAAGCGDSDGPVGEDGTPVELGTAGDFAILAKSGVSTVPASAITGDVGVSPAAATYITGFSLTMDTTNEFATSAQVTGKLYSSDYAAPTPLDALWFTAWSPLPNNVLTLDSGSDRVVVAFDTPGKRSGVPVELQIEPVARDLGFLAGARREYIYRFTLETTDGWMPARKDPESQDHRYLSTFLSFTGEGP